MGSHKLDWLEMGRKKPAKKSLRRGKRGRKQTQFYLNERLGGQLQSSYIKEQSAFKHQARLDKNENIRIAKERRAAKRNTKKARNQKKESKPQKKVLKKTATAPKIKAKLQKAEVKTAKIKVQRNKRAKSKQPKKPKRENRSVANTLHIKIEIQAPTKISTRTIKKASTKTRKLRQSQKPKKKTQRVKPRKRSSQKTTSTRQSKRKLRNYVARLDNGHHFRQSRHMNRKAPLDGESCAVIEAEGTEYLYDQDIKQKYGYISDDDFVVSDNDVHALREQEWTSDEDESSSKRTTRKKKLTKKKSKK